MRLVVDLSNKSAQLIDGAGHCIAMWSDVTRQTALSEARGAGWWQLGDWELTSPPDGYQCTLQRRPHPDGWPSAEEIDLGSGVIRYDGKIEYIDGDTLHVVPIFAIQRDKPRPLYMKHAERVFGRQRRLMVQLVDMDGAIYAASDAWLRELPPPEPSGLMAELLAAINQREQQGHTVRAALMELASTWRKRGAIYGPGAGVLVSCARELDETTIQHLSEQSELFAGCEASREILGQHRPEPFHSGGYYCTSCGSGEPYEYPTDWPCGVIMAECKRYAVNPGDVADSNG